MCDWMDEQTKTKSNQTNLTTFLSLEPRHTIALVRYN